MTRRLRGRSLILALLLILVAVPTAVGATLVTEDEYVVPADQTIEGNLYVFARTVTVKGTVTGDLVTAAQKVTIDTTGIVGEDVLAAGQSVIVRGTVEGDYRAAGFTVELDDNAATGGDLVGAAYSISAGEGSIVQGSVLAAGYQLLLDGDVAGDVRFAGAALDIQGSVSGNVVADVESTSESAPPPLFFFGTAPPRSASPGLTLSDDAQIGGDLTLTTPDALEIEQGVVGGEVTIEQTETEQAEDETAAEEEEDLAAKATDQAVAFAKRYLSLLVLGLVLLWLRPVTMRSAADVLSARKLPSLGWGFVTVAVAIVLTMLIPIVTIAVVAFLGLIQLQPLIAPVLAFGGLQWFVVVLGTYLLTWVARIVFAVWSAQAIYRRIAPKLAGNRLALLLLGLLIYVVLVSIPYVGWLFKAVFILLGIGALEVHTWFSWLMHRDEVAPVQSDV
jgi:cytoskeletal protein CcmA (bactofilin family)